MNSGAAQLVLPGRPHFIGWNRNAKQSFGHPRAWLGLEGLPQCPAAASTLPFRVTRAFHRAVWAASWLGSWLTPRAHVLREQNGNENLFYEVALGATLCPVCRSLLFTPDIFFTHSRRRIHRCVATKRKEPTEDPPGACQPQVHP